MRKLYKEGNDLYTGVMGNVPRRIIKFNPRIRQI